MISSPGCAGRQCSAIASSRAWASSASSSRYGASSSRRRSASVLVAHAHPHVGVDGVRAAHGLGWVQRRAPRAATAPAARPPPPPRRRSARRSAASGPCCCRRPRRRASGPRACRSARAASSGRRAPGRGGARCVSMLITGIDACSASSSTVSCGPVRMPIAWTIRESTSATSRGDSPRAICSSPCAQDQRVAAQLEHAGLERDARARGRLVEHERDALAFQRARRQAVGLELERALEEPPLSSAVVSSSPVRKCLANASPQLESLPRARLPARPGPLHAPLAPAARDRAQRDARAGEPLAAAREFARLARRPRVGRGAASGGAAALVRRACPARTAATGVRAFTSRNWCPRCSGWLADSATRT